MASHIGLTFPASDAGKGPREPMSGRALGTLTLTALHLRNCFSELSMELPGDPS